MQKIMFHIIKRGQTSYDTSRPRDYAANRAAEEKGVPQKLPKGIMIREVMLDSIEGELLFSDNNPKDKCIMYIHDGGLVTGSTKTVRPLASELVKQTGYNLTEEVRATYLISDDPSVIRNPYAAPYYGDYTGFPPTLIIASDSEVLRDDSVFLHEKMKRSGAESRLHLYHIISGWGYRQDKIVYHIEIPPNMMAEILIEGLKKERWIQEYMILKYV